MKTKFDESFGIIPVHTEEDVLKFFLIHQYSSLTGNTYWVFPKGHKEGEEPPIETAKRELEEETGLRPVRIDDRKSFVLSYDFLHEGMKIDKSVTFFIGYIEDTKPSFDSHEVKEGGWFDTDRARERITHENMRTVFDKAVHYLKNAK